MITAVLVLSKHFERSFWLLNIRLVKLVLLHPFQGLGKTILKMTRAKTWPLVHVILLKSQRKCL